jgi:hypothetical protein
MLNFFKAFPLVQYQFEEDSNEKNIIIDINRNVRAYISEMDNANAYLFYEVSDGSRPDQVSMELYGTPAYYWTFFVVNEDLSNGLHEWPKSSQELTNFVDETYFRTAITLESKLGASSTSHHLYKYPTLVIGETVTGLTSLATGKIAEINYTTNSLILSDVTGTFADEDFVTGTSRLGFSVGTLFKHIVTKEKDAPHHYIDSQGRIVDRLNFNVSDSQLPVSNYEHEVNVNDRKLSIRVINPAAIDSFATRYRKLINS